MTKLINGKEIAQNLRNQLKEEIHELKSKTGKVPGLAVVQVGNVAASSVYVKAKTKSAKEVGIDLEARDNRGRTPMHHMCTWEFNIKISVEKFLEAAKKEFGIEFNLEATDEDGKTPFELFPEPE